MGILPKEGLIPKTPLKELGILTEPPPSDPNAKCPNPAAIDAPAPPLDPPEVLFKFQGFKVVPKILLSVTGI